MTVCDICQSTDSVMAISVDTVVNEEPVLDGITRKADLCLKCRMELAEVLGSWFDKVVSSAKEVVVPA